MKTKKESLWALILLSTTLAFLMVLMAGFALANASQNTEKELNTSSIFSDVGRSLFGEHQPVYSGIYIYKEDGQDAEEDVDFKFLKDDPGDENPSQIELLSDKLTVEGISLEEPGVDIGLLASSTCHNLTIKNLYLNYTGNHSVLRVDLPKVEQKINGDAFNLNIDGKCYLYQNGEKQENNHAICFDNGFNKNNVNINGVGNAESYLECYTQVTDTIFSFHTAITMNGNLELLAYVTEGTTGGDVIDWDNNGAEHEDNDNLTLKDNVKLYVGNEKSNDETAIVAGTIKVLDNSSLYALNYSTATRLPTVRSHDYFEINTTGEVYIEALNPKSWQSVECNNFTIMKCDGGFTAIAQDYTAVECSGVFEIQKAAIKNIYISGCFEGNDESDHRAKRGAFTVKHTRNLSLPDGYLMFGSEDLEADVDFIKKRAVTTFSSGEEQANGYEYDVYTPILPKSGALPEYAKTVIFKEAKEVVFVPGKNATYSEAGFKPCYKYKDSEVYFEDYDQQIPIVDYETWKTDENLGYIPSLDASFEDYRQAILDKCEELYVFGDSPEIDKLIQSAKSKIENYIYGENLTLNSNKANLDGIYDGLKWDIDNLPLPVPEPITWDSSTDDEFFYDSNAGNENANKNANANANENSNANENTDDNLFGNINNFINYFGNIANSIFHDEPYPGLYIMKGDQPATPGEDFEVKKESKCLDILSNGLTISGVSTDNVEVSIYVKKGVTDLTIKDVHIYSQKFHDHAYGNTLTIDLLEEEPQSSDSATETNEWGVPAAFENFKLNVLGDCYIYQRGEDQGGSAIYVYNGNTQGIEITGPEGSSLTLYTRYFEPIYLWTVPLTFSGELNVELRSYRDRCINWYNQSQKDWLFVTGNSTLKCITYENNINEAIKCGNLFVVGNANLYVTNNANAVPNTSTIDTRHWFGVSTEGDVIVGNVSQNVCQAIKCENLSILNCKEFVAVSKKYAAVECSESMTIQTPNVWLYGQFNLEETTNSARKGAFTIKDIKKFYVASNLTMLGSQNEPEGIPVEEWGPIENLTTMVRTSGDDVYDMYSPVACDGNLATIAKMITFVNSSHNVQLVPGEAPSFALPGYKDCYKCNDCSIYFADEQCETKIADLEFWRSPLGDGFLVPYCFEFKIYQAEIRCQCEENMIKRANVPEIRAMIAAAQAKIDAYVYDDGLSLAANKAAIKKIYYELYDEVMNYPPYVPPPGPDPVPAVEEINAAAHTGDTSLLYVYMLISIVAIAGTATTLSVRKNNYRR